MRVAVDRLVLAEAELGDLSWAKPYLDKARASLARGEGIPAEKVFAETDAWLKERGARAFST